MGQAKDLGLIKAIWVQTTPPENKKVIWFDDNVGVKTHKTYDFATNTWVVLNQNIAQQQKQQNGIIKFVPNKQGVGQPNSTELLVTHDFLLQKDGDCVDCRFALRHLAAQNGDAQIHLTFDGSANIIFLRQDTQSEQAVWCCVRITRINATTYNTSVLQASSTNYTNNTVEQLQDIFMTNQAWGSVGQADFTNLVNFSLSITNTGQNDVDYSLGFFSIEYKNSI